MDHKHMANRNLVVAAMTILVSGFVLGGYILGGESMLAKITAMQADAMYQSR